MVVCTLCSCYPKALLGPPPDWYKSLPYRSRAVSDPRGVLSEFGVELEDDVELRVLDSTADIRYLVIPRRPAGSETLSEVELAALVARDSMIGIAPPKLRPRPNDFLNGDEAAAALALGLRAERIVFLTDVEGLYLDGALATAVRTVDADRLLASRTLQGGIVPKLRAAVTATRGGVRAEIGATLLVA